MRPGKTPKDVDAYLSRLPVPQRNVLQKLRKAVRKAAPDAAEIISYGIPAYKDHGPVVFFAAYANHCSLFAVSGKILKRFSKELEPFELSGTTIHFQPEHPLSDTLVGKLVRTRVAQNRLRVKAGKRTRKA